MPDVHPRFGAASVRSVCRRGTMLVDELAARVAHRCTRDDEADTETYDASETPQEALDRALAYWAKPALSATTRNRLIEFGEDVEAAIRANWQRSAYRALRQNALRMLIATSPDMQAV